MKVLPEQNAGSNILFHPKHFLCLLLVLVVSTSYAQFNRYRNYDVKDGLPSSEVYDVIQDRKGFIWLTSDMGVSRYDGYEFHNYTTDDGLPDNTIFDAYEDYAGRIWFISFSGKLSYFGDEKIHTLPCNDSLMKIMRGYYITSIYVDRQDTLWVGTVFNDFIKISPGWNAKDISVKTFNRSEGYLMLVDDSGLVHGSESMATTDVVVMNRKGERLYSVKLQEPTISEPGMRTSYRRLPSGNILATANYGIAVFNENGVIRSADLGGVGICTQLQDDGIISVGTYNGVVTFTGEDLTHQARIPKFENRIITTILRDTEGSMWYGTEGNGVFNCFNHSFLYYTPDDGLPESKITCAALYNSVIYTGHIDGMMSRLHEQSVQTMIPEIAGTFPGLSNRITSIIPDGDNRILVSTANAYYKVSTDNKLIATIHERGCKKMIRAKDGSILAFRFRSLTRFKSAGFTMESDVPFPRYADNVFEDSRGCTWLCALNGIWVCDQKNNMVFMGDSIPQLSARVVDVDESSPGNFWFVTRGSGAVFVSGDSIMTINANTGLASNMCRSLYVQSDSVVWIGTNNGVSRISFSAVQNWSYHIVNYTSENGLLSNEVTEILGDSNKLWLIHTNGISVFDPTNLQKTDFTPPVYITAVTVNGDSVTTGGQQFNSDENYVSFSFVGLSFRDPGKVKYRYKLEGADRDWVYSKNTVAAYQALAPGDYRFLVEASSNEGLWSQPKMSGAFTILPAWWQTWYFKLLLGIAIAVILGLLFTWRLKTIRKRELRKSLLQNRVTTYELEALRAQMNPHFVFNAINSVQYFITNNDPDSSQKYLSKFARLIRYVVDNSRLSSIALRNETDALQLYLELEALRFGNRLKYAIEIDPDVDAEYIQIPSMLIQPFVENAIWHGIMHKKGEGKIEVRISVKGQILTCIVEDDGVGREFSARIKKEKMQEGYKSVGMNNTNERLEIINQVTGSNLSVEITDLKDENGNAAGTRVKIHVPI